MGRPKSSTRLSQGAGEGRGTRTRGIPEASVSSKAPPLNMPEMTPANKARAAAARVEKNPIVSRFVRKSLLKARLSPAAAVAERAEKAARANDRPTTLSAVL